MTVRPFPLAVVIAAAATVLLAACGAPADPSGPVPAADPVDHSAGLVQPGSVHLDAGLSPARAQHIVRTAQSLYTFWNTGQEPYLTRVEDHDFLDNTLPPGRAQGQAGQLTAAAAFRTAIPDLSCELADLYVTGDTFTARLVFRGHFTGTYNGVPGKRQPITFNAIDIQHLGNGATITEDWHLEDNLAFLQQADLVTVAGTS